jgi:hypothetical protein
MRLRNVATFPRFILLSMYCPVLYCTEMFLFFCLSFTPSDEWVSRFLLIMHMTEKTLSAFVSWMHGVCRP